MMQHAGEREGGEVTGALEAEGETVGVFVDGHRLAGREQAREQWRRFGRTRTSAVCQVAQVREHLVERIGGCHRRVVPRRRAGEHSYIYAKRADLPQAVVSFFTQAAYLSIQPCRNLRVSASAKLPASSKKPSLTCRYTSGCPNVGMSR